jgi:hypothetical protein
MLTGKRSLVWPTVSLAVCRVKATTAKLASSICRCKEVEVVGADKGGKVASIG